MWNCSAGYKTAESQIVIRLLYFHKLKKDLKDFKNKAKEEKRTFFFFGFFLCVLLLTIKFANSYRKTKLTFEGKRTFATVTSRDHRGSADWLTIEYSIDNIAYYNAICANEYEAKEKARVIDSSIIFIRYDPDKPTTIQLEFDEHFLKHDLKSARELIRKVPDNIEAYKIKGIHEYENKLYKESLRDFLITIAIDSNYVLGYNSVGIIYGDLKDYFNSFRYFEKSIRLNPKLPKTYYYRSKVFLDLKDYKRAIEDCNKAIALNPKYREAIVRRGQARYLSGDIKGACEDAKLAKKLGWYDVKTNIPVDCDF